MHGIGIPTTRAGALLLCGPPRPRSASDRPTRLTRLTVRRDVQYDGTIVDESAAVLLRVCPTFMRFGSFEIFKASDPLTGQEGPSTGHEVDMLPRMLDYVIAEQYPHLWEEHAGLLGVSPECSWQEEEEAKTTGRGAGGRSGGGGNNRGGEEDLHPDLHPVVGGGGGGDSLPPGRGTLEGSLPEVKRPMYIAFYRECASRTASLCAQWMAQGFVHGVLNSDNMSIIGHTLDYGPYGWMERYNPRYAPNASDESGYYAFQYQPERCRFNVQVRKGRRKGGRDEGGEGREKRERSIYIYILSHPIIRSHTLSSIIHHPNPDPNPNPNPNPNPTPGHHPPPHPTPPHLPTLYPLI